MQGLGTLINTILMQAQQFILVPMLILAISMGGYMWMIGDHRGAKTWITGGLIGAGIVFGAKTIAAMVSGVGGSG